MFFRAAPPRAITRGVGGMLDIGQEVGSIHVLAIMPVNVNL